jgi:hypothetical protein
LLTDLENVYIELILALGSIGWTYTINNEIIWCVESIWITQRID